MASKLSMSRSYDPDLIESSLFIIEQHHPDLELHGWIQDDDRGNWINRYGNHFIFTQEVSYKGYACVVDTVDGYQLHIGTIRESMAVRAILRGWQLLKDELIRVGIDSIYCLPDGRPVLERILIRVGFTEVTTGKYLCVLDK